jgi:hypothetical protein
MPTCKGCKEVFGVADIQDGFCKECYTPERAKKAYYIDGEKKIMESGNGELILTTHRVRYDSKIMGKQTIVSMMLDEVCSCEMNYKSNAILVLLAGLSFLAGFSGIYLPLVGIGIALVLLAIYFITREQYLTISSAASAINVKVKGMKVELIKEFIDALESAKHEYKR